MTKITTSLERTVKSSFSMIGGEITFILMADPIALDTAISQEDTVSLETRPDWYVMGTAEFEPTTSTG
jgi:hypothetical protein